MKKILVFVFIITSCLRAFTQTSPPGNDTARYIWYRYQYGIRYNRGQFDSVLGIPKDTSYSKAGIATKSGLFFYWDGARWNTPGGGGSGGGLSVLTANSPLGSNTVGGAVNIFADTLNSHPYGLATQWNLTQREPLVTAPFLPGYYYNGYKKMVLLNTDSLFQGTNKFYSNTLARGAFSALAPLLYNSSTGVYSADTSAGLAHLATQAYVLAHASTGGGYIPDTAYLATRRYVDSLAKPKLSITTIGTSGVATYNPASNVLNIPNYTFSGGGSATIPPNVGAGFRIYKLQVSGFATLFGSYGFAWDSTTNTNGLTGKIDSTLFVTKLFFNANRSGGAITKDTAGVYYIGAGLKMLRASSPDSLKSRTEIDGYAIISDTTAGGAKTTKADTAGAHALASKDRLAAAIAAALSGGGGYTAAYGLRLGGTTFVSDTPRLKVGEAYPLRANDATYDNGVYINAALVLAKSLHINIELPKDTFYIKTTILPQSGVFMYGQGRQTVIKGAFTSDHVLVNNPSAVLNDFGMVDIALDRRGTNNSHGAMFANAHRIYITRVFFFDNDTTAAGGALGFSAFTPWVSYPSDNIFVTDCYFEGSGNFGTQFGNCDWFYVTGARGRRNRREFVGVEPYSISGEGGATRHGFITNCHNFNPSDTYPNGSNTGVFIATTSSKGIMEDIHFTNCVDSGGNITTMHGFNFLGVNDVYAMDCSSYSNGGYGLQVTSASTTISTNVHVLRFKAARNGLDGVSNAGIYVHDTKLSDFDVNVEGNVWGIIEDGVSELNQFSGNVLNNTNKISLNTGRTHYSVVRNLITDSLAPKTGLLVYDANRGSQIIAARTAGSYPLLDIHTADSLYGPIVSSGYTTQIITTGGNQTVSATNSIVYVDPSTTLSTLVLYMPSAPVDKQGVIFDFGGTLTASGQAVVNALSLNGNGNSIIGDVSPIPVTGQHFTMRWRASTSKWYVEAGNIKAGYISGVGGKMFNDYRVNDSAGIHISWQLRYNDDTYANALPWPGYPAQSGSAGMQNLESVLTQGATISGFHPISVLTGAGGLVLNFANNTNFSITNANPLDLNFIVGRFSANTLEHSPFNITSNITLDGSYDEFTVSASSGNRVITIGPSLSYLKLSFLRIDNSSNTVTIQLSGGTINGASTYTGLTAEGKNVEMKCISSKCYITSTN